MSDNKTASVRMFWPAERLDALRAFARDPMPGDNFEHSMRLQWMREFCMQAPDWLEVESRRQKWVARIEELRQQLIVVQESLRDVVREIDAVPVVPRDNRIDAWAERMAKAAAEPAKPVLTETPAPLPPTVPEPGMLLPAEMMFAAAHSSDTPKAPPAEMRVPAPVVVGDKKEEEKAKSKEEEESPAAAPQLSGAERRRADAKNARRRRARRTSYQMELQNLAHEHSEELAIYVAHNILENTVTTGRIRQAMQRYVGTFTTRQAAAKAYAQANNANIEYIAQGTGLLAKAPHVLEYDDGRLSVWR